jgi:hypothetical protein
VCVECEHIIRTGAKDKELAGRMREEEENEREEVTHEIQ